MGVYLSKAKTEKSSDFGGTLEDGDTRYGLTSMQGWRQTMEDAHLACPDVRELEAILNREVGLYGVFDGHGGPAVSAWIAKHLVRVLQQEITNLKNEGKSLGRPASSSSDESPQQFDEDVVLLSESLCKTFIGLDEEMQRPEHLDEMRTINDDLQAKNAQDDQEDDDSGSGDAPASSLKSLLSNQPRSFLQAFLNNTRPVIKLVEQDGEQFFHITPSSGNEEEEEATGPSCIEEIVEDPHVTAPETKSPRLAQAFIEEVKAEGSEKADDLLQQSEEKCEDVEAPSPTTAVMCTAAKHISDAKENTESEEQSAKEPTTGELHPQISVDEVQMRPGIPETCGAAVVVCAVLGGDKPVLITANAGDSRCVLCRDGVAIAQSHDHKPYLLQEMNRIRKAGGTIEHGRVDGNLNLSRTLGDLFYKRNKALKPEEQKITAYPDVIITPITPQDDFVILACDGIWDCMTNQQACDFVISRLGDNPTPEHLSKICEEMCDSCLAGRKFFSKSHFLQTPWNQKEALVVTT